MLQTQDSRIKISSGQWSQVLVKWEV
jgi:hypothetical protein